MKTAIYYFSATGNSLTTARLIAEGLGECALIPVASLRGKAKIVVDAECVGFIFPVYYGNMPWPMREAVSKMAFKGDAYTFAVTTQRGHAGAAAKRLDQLLRTRGVKLDLARGVDLPGNSFISTEEQAKAQLSNQRAAVETIIPAIEKGMKEDNSSMELMPLTPIGYPNNFRGIMADENCVGCGMCEKVCPMGNIKVENGRAVIGDDCATCLACFHWCPQEAIWMSKQQGIERRAKYHHPDVTYADILAQKK